MICWAVHKIVSLIVHDDLYENILTHLKEVASQ